MQSMRRSQDACLKSNLSGPWRDAISNFVLSDDPNYFYGRLGIHVRADQGHSGYPLSTLPKEEIRHRSSWHVSIFLRRLFGSNTKRLARAEVRMD